MGCKGGPKPGEEAGFPPSHARGAPASCTCAEHEDVSCRRATFLQPWLATRCISRRKGAGCWREEVRQTGSAGDPLPSTWGDTHVAAGMESCPPGLVHHGSARSLTPLLLSAMGRLSPATGPAWAASTAVGPPATACSHLAPKQPGPQQPCKDVSPSWPLRGDLPRVPWRHERWRSPVTQGGTAAGLAPAGPVGHGCGQVIAGSFLAETKGLQRPEVSGKSLQQGGEKPEPGASHPLAVCSQHGTIGLPDSRFGTNAPPGKAA